MPERLGIAILFAVVATILALPMTFPALAWLTFSVRLALGL